MAKLPLILAGPMLRRVEPGLVAVWVALSEPRLVRLSVLDGVVNAGPGESLFSSPSPLAIGADRSLRLVDKLHIALAIARPKVPLLPDHAYSYHLSFADFDSKALDEKFKFKNEDFTPLEDLKSLKLLQNGPLDGRDHLALGYDPGELPGFALPPSELGHLRLLHGSCRRLGQESNDGLAWVDDLILEWRKDPDPRLRPHQLFMTGDQIYADDVALPLLPIVNEAALQLFGDLELLPTRFPLPEGDDLREELKDEKAAKRLARQLNDRCPIKLSETIREPFLNPGGFETDPNEPDLRLWPADLLHFPAGLRTNVMDCDAHFSSIDLKSHLMSLGEYCAMYLLHFSNTLWPVETQPGDQQGKVKFKALKELYALPKDASQIWELHTAGLECKPQDHPPAKKIDRIRKCLEELGEDEDDKKAYKKVSGILEKAFKVLPKVRRALANIPTYMIFDDHDVTDDWNLMQAWCDRVHTTALGRTIVRNALVAYAFFQGWGNDPDSFMRFENEADMLRRLPNEQDNFLNIKDGGNGLLLLAARLLFPPGVTRGPDRQMNAFLDRLFGLHQRDAIPHTRWHYTVPGARHRVLALDTRTRRIFRSRHSPPGLISPSAMVEQIGPELQGALPAGIEVLVVLSATGVIQPAVTTSLVVPLLNSFHDLRNFRELKNMPGTDTDAEIWPGDIPASEDLLKRLAFHRRVVVLSGEIHHAFSASLSYWRKLEGPPLFSTKSEFSDELDQCEVPPGLRAAFDKAEQPLSEEVKVTPRLGHSEWLITDQEKRRMYLLSLSRNPGSGDRIDVFAEETPARIAQFTSSGLKNQKDLIVTLARGFGFSARLLSLGAAERLGWDSSLPRPVEVSKEAQVPPSVRASLEVSPAVISTKGWPAGTRLERAPDFTWRFQIVADQRPDSERPADVKPDALAAEFDPKEIAKSYHAIARRHASLLDDLRHSRAVVYANNLGMVYFEGTGDTLEAVQDLYTDGGAFLKKPFVAARHRIPLHVFGEERPRLFFDPAFPGVEDQ